MLMRRNRISVIGQRRIIGRQDVDICQLVFSIQNIVYLRKLAIEGVLRRTRLRRSVVG